MERIDLGSDLLPVTIFGVDVDLKKPGMAAVLDNEKKVKDAGEDPEKIFQIMQDFICSMGMPKELADRMQLDQYTQLMEALKGKKKN